MQTAAPIISPAEKQALIDRFLDGLTPSAGHRQLYAMAGVPGAGKSTFVARAQADGRFPAAAFILNPDRVMDALDGYRADHATLGAAAAFARWEMSARALAYELGHMAAARGLPIIKDMGMVRAENWMMLRDFKAQGYAIDMHVILCDTALAQESAARRERHFPLEQIVARADDLQACLAQHGDVPDKIFWYERKGGDDIRAIKKQGSK